MGVGIKNLGIVYFKIDRWWLWKKNFVGVKSFLFLELSCWWFPGRHIFCMSILRDCWLYSRYRFVKDFDLSLCYTVFRHQQWRRPFEGGEMVFWGFYFRYRHWKKCSLPIVKLTLFCSVRGGLYASSGTMVMV